MLLKELEHIGIPRIYDIEEDRKNLYIIEEFIRGESLDTYIKSNQIGEIQVLEIIMQLCNIFDYLHTSLNEPIVYQDLKPDHILITDMMQVKLIDFGCAMKQNQIKYENVKWITPEFAAPEILSNQEVDYRADIYSIGKIVDYIVHNNKISLSHSSILPSIMKGCLAKSPKKRFHNINSIITILNRKITELSNNNKIKTICILGSQRRIGTTHCSLMIGKVLKQNGYDVVLRESNENSCLDQLLERNKIKKEKGEPYQIGGLEILPASQEDRDCIRNQYIVHDCGEMREEMPKGDHYILIVGTREWELDHTERMIRKLYHLDNLVIIFNLCKKEWFHKMEKALMGKRCFCMPYVQNPFRVEEAIRKKISKFLDVI